MTETTALSADAQPEIAPIRAFFAPAAIFLTLIGQLILPKAAAITAKSLPWYTDVLLIALAVTVGLALYHLFTAKAQVTFTPKVGTQLWGYLYD
ncbi:hypothetical protein [Lacticaseibacillus sp. N501-2]|uniref:hypothetical protein n=1 Tax=Lacticaseibacillus salsurae TaxID=3367729 RepID=UPI0038B2FA5B